jgi:hypothetical protein
MTTRANRSLFAIGAAVVLTAVMTVSSFAQDKAEPRHKEGDKHSEKVAGQPSEQEMMAAMMEMSKVGDNHKLLARGVGEWTYKMKTWMNPDPNAPPSESSGTATVKPLLGGRYFQGDHSGKFQMPGADGKMMDMDFKGTAIEGYDNVKKKFVSTWIDNMSTGIMMSEGTYDAGTKTFTFHAEFEMMPGMKTKIREVFKITDNDHKTLEFYEDRGGTEVKTMEIAYTRKN